MTIKITLEVTIDRFKAEASEKGNFTAQGITCEVTKIVGAVAEQMTVFPPKGGNAGQIMFIAKDPQLVKKVNAAYNKTVKAPKGTQSMPQFTPEQMAAFQAFLAMQDAQAKK
jgi:hypothetical protein